MLDNKQFEKKFELVPLFHGNSSYEYQNLVKCYTNGKY